MTQYLAEAAREVAAVEIDSSLIPILKDTLKDWDNVSVINNDILKTDIKKIADEKNGGKPVKVVANLPYYITTPIIMGLFEKNVPVASHNTAQPGKAHRNPWYRDQPAYGLQPPSAP